MFLIIWKSTKHTVTVGLFPAQYFGETSATFFRRKVTKQRQSSTDENNSKDQIPTKLQFH
jgi:hypothetical protein